MNAIRTDTHFIDDLIVRYEEAGVKLSAPVSRIRDISLRNVKKNGIPDRHDEDYKYFNIHRKIDRPYSFILQDAGVEYLENIRSEMIKDPDGVHIVFVNGSLSALLSNQNTESNGIELLNLMDHSERLDDLFEKYLQNVQNVNNDRFIDLNHAFPNAGYALLIDQKIGPGKVYIYHFYTDDLNEDLLFNHKALIFVGRDTKCNIVEKYFTQTKRHYFANYLSEIFVDNNAFLNYYLLQESGENNINIHNTNVYQKENSRVRTYTFSLQGAHLRNNLNLLLDQENIESYLFGLYLVGNEDHIDHHTTVDHKKPHCYSNEFYKGIIDDRGTGTFNGKIFVRPNAQKTNAFQSNKNLVLTDKASINTKPQLEIWADDVKCSHGATTGQIDEEQLFYLRSRGLAKETATALLLHAFAFEIVDKIEIDPVRKDVASKINRRLGYNFSD